MKYEKIILDTDMCIKIGDIAITSLGLMTLNKH